MARMPMGPYSPYKTGLNLAKKYEGKTYDEQEKMIKTDRPFFREALKPENMGGRSFPALANPIDVSPRGKALKRMKGKKK